MYYSKNGIEQCVIFHATKIITFYYQQLEKRQLNKKISKTRWVKIEFSSNR